MKGAFQTDKHEKPALAILLFAIFLLPVILFAAPKQKNTPPPVQLGADGKLIYHADSLGNRIPDFSYCGYQLSEIPVPNVEVKIVVPLVEGDATGEIQKALDYLVSLPLNENGFRGAVLLEPGTYNVSGRFKIEASGIVIRGSGWNKTVIIADGLARETLFRVEGGANEYSEETINITNDYVPVNAFQFDLENANALNAGDVIEITLPFSQDWINFLGMNNFGGETDWLQWRAGYHSMKWLRTIQSIDGKTITIDVPITTPIDSRFGEAMVKKLPSDNRITNVGVENLFLKSTYNTENPKDEEHCWNAISFENAENCWVRQVKFKHFAGSAVATYETASKITVEDCISTDPVSEIAAYRRNTFFNGGSLNLFQRLYSEKGYHDFSTGFMATGPNAFVQCESVLPHSFSGAIDSWASGVLFDIVNVDGHKLSFANRGQDAQGAGWTAAFSMFWQCSAARIENFAPPGTVNWAYGAWGQFAGNGYWYEANSHVNPRSLFYAQLAERIGKDKIPQNPFIEYNTDATSSPTIEMAAEIVGYFQKPVKTLKQWIEDEAVIRNPISGEIPKNAIISSDLLFKNEKTETNKREITHIKNGWIVHGDKVITGLTTGVPWWNFKNRPRELERAQLALTRFVPGRTGKGYTDNLHDVLDEMECNNIGIIEQHYALWYERRRDDHERIRRMDGDVWAPFYEVPFSRSGEGLAWDHLSKYDLTSYNPWYWGRLKEFANMADREGKILFHQNFFQHNILEAGAHWVDSPWRTVNNINNTDFPEPPPFAGDKRIFIADKFYDVSHTVRRELYKKYIRQCLDNFKDNTAVIQSISEEYTGPFEFVAFWLDVIAEWEKENNKDVLVALSTTKDVQDSILADPERSEIVDVIDIRYWSSRPDGSVYAPKSGLNLAPRQFARLENPGKRSFEQVYNDVLSYRLKYPGKAVMYSENRSNAFAWAIFMASGSLAPIPKIENPQFLENASTMKVDLHEVDKIYRLHNSNGESICYLKGGEEATVDLTGFTGEFTVELFDSKTGNLIDNSRKIKGGLQHSINTNGLSEIIIWVHK